MIDWQETHDGIIAKIDAFLANGGWYKNNCGEWERELTVAELGDPSIYIGPRPLATIMTGGALDVYGVGATGVANFICETYVTLTFEENLTETISFTPEEQIWFEDGDNWDEISAYVQGWIRPIMDSDDVNMWLESQGW